MKATAAPLTLAVDRNETIHGQLHSSEMEAQLLGALLTDNSLMSAMVSLKPEHFAVPVHQRIFAVIQSAVEEGRLATPPALKRQFQADPELTPAGGGSDYLARCLASATNYPVETARQIHDLAQRRKLLEVCRATIDSITGNQPPAAIALDLAESCEGIVQGIDDSKIEGDMAVSERILKGLKETAAPFSTGLWGLDEAMDGGLFAGKSYGFAAKKKTGKTVLAGSISHNLNQAGVKHLFICGEMSPDEIQERNLARVAGVYGSAFRSPYAKTQDFQDKIAAAAAKSKNCTLYRNAPGLTFESLRRIVTRAILQHRIKGVILDYWQLVGGKANGQTTAEHLDEVAQWIADTCRKHKIWSVVMAQINQGGNTRGGEGIRLAFDQVFQMHRLGPDSPQIWLEMMDTRYTKWRNIGDESTAGMVMNEKGPFFEMPRTDLAMNAAAAETTQAAREGHDRRYGS